MTIFALFAYSCLTITGVDGSLSSKTRQWSANSAFYQSEARCAEAGAAQVGNKVHSFNIVIGSDHRVENFKCVQQHVE